MFYLGRGGTSWNYFSSLVVKKMIIEPIIAKAKSGNVMKIKVNAVTALIIK
jgi:hypothetical protein